MNANFAAAHGIGEDPLAKENHRVVYAKPQPQPVEATVRIPPARVEPSARAGYEPSSPPPSSSSSVAEELDDDVSLPGSDAGSKDSLEAEDARDEHHDDSSMDRLHLPPPRASSPVRESRRGRFSTNDGDLEALRSAALEADTRFVNLPETNAGEGEDVETLEAAMARARVERAREENGGVGGAVARPSRGGSGSGSPRSGSPRSGSPRSGSSGSGSSGFESERESGSGSDGRRDDRARARPRRDDAADAPGAPDTPDAPPDASGTPSFRDPSASDAGDLVERRDGFGLFFVSPRRARRAARVAATPRGRVRGSRASERRGSRGGGGRFSPRDSSRFARRAIGGSPATFAARRRR